MTIAHRATPNGLARNKYKCDVCAKVDFWGPEWSRYSSYALDEECPDDVPTACSKECGKAMMENIRKGKWKLPRLRNKGYYSEIIAEREGY